MHDTSLCSNRSKCAVDAGGNGDCRTAGVAFNATLVLTAVPVSATSPPPRSRRAPFRKGRPEKRSGGGAYGRICHPLPGGSGPPLDRHDDRSPRSSVDSRQIEAGNARQVRSQETRELELSQRRMRSPWRVPQQSAGRRARPELARGRARTDRPQGL
jgi:hypothetical protein